MHFDLLGALKVLLLWGDSGLCPCPEEGENCAAQGIGLECPDGGGVSSADAKDPWSVTSARRFEVAAECVTRLLITGVVEHPLR